MLKPSLQLRIGQHLTMTPQLQQAIRLLQLSSLELQAEIQQVFESNPMLETAEEDTDQDAETRENASDADEAGEGLEEDDIAITLTEIPGEELPVDSNWEDTYDNYHSQTGVADVNGKDLFENQPGAGESLQDHLLWQLRMASLSGSDQMIALSIIDAINEDGYLTEKIEDIHADLAADNDNEIEPDEVEAVLHFIQHLDPIGCGARDLAECLDIQLQQFPDIGNLDAARDIVTKHLDLLGSRDFKQIIRKLKISQDELEQIVALIQTLNPKPGDSISCRTSEYVIPDVLVYKKANSWLVELNPDTAPRVRINSLYAGMIKRADNSQDNTYMRDQLQEARWFIKSLQSRHETLLKVATAIVEHQRAFLEYGDEAMKPLVLRDIAEQLEMHESTISRVTTQKYMHTPRGIYEFKYFFSSHVSTSDGGMCSATAIRAMIKKLIAEENSGKPFSDSKIAAILTEKGINVARRTVAKYREAMSISPSNERKRLN